jgi:GR25 family glycosyltransferase involved in LPS biosynthesis
MNNNLGFNNFDMVCYINLDHRKDRLEHITNELNKTNIDKNKIHRISAIYNPKFGAIGCSKSHILALETFLKSPETNKNCLILEDDFEFTQSQYFINELLDNVFNIFNCQTNTFDVLMLASNTIQEINSPEILYVTKILNSQTASGYVVSRKFAPILLDNYRKSISLLEPHCINGKPDIHICSKYCIDMYFKILQPNYNWYCLKPKIGKQMISYSDIEECMVNYGV